jgi:hypothetical protein
MQKKIENGWKKLMVIDLEGGYGLGTGIFFEVFIWLMH